MDRTSILGDTIDYMKELLEKINNLQLETDANPNSTGISKNVITNEVLVRNSTKVRTSSSCSAHNNACKDSQN